MTAEIVKKHELEILRFGNQVAVPASKAASQAAAMLQYKGINADTIAELKKASAASIAAGEKLIKMCLEHPEDFNPEFDIEQFKKDFGL